MSGVPAAGSVYAAEIAGAARNSLKPKPPGAAPQPCPGKAPASPHAAGGRSPAHRLSAPGQLSPTRGGRGTQAPTRVAYGSVAGSPTIAQSPARASPRSQPGLALQASSEGMLPMVGAAQASRPMVAALAVPSLSAPPSPASSTPVKGAGSPAACGISPSGSGGHGKGGRSVRLPPLGDYSSATLPPSPSGASGVSVKRSVDLARSPASSPSPGRLSMPGVAITNPLARLQERGGDLMPGPLALGSAPATPAAAAIPAAHFGAAGAAAVDPGADAQQRVLWSAASMEAGTLPRQAAAGRRSLLGPARSRPAEPASAAVPASGPAASAAPLPEAAAAALKEQGLLRRLWGRLHGKVPGSGAVSSEVTSLRNDSSVRVEAAEPPAPAADAGPAAQDPRAAGPAGGPLKPSVTGAALPAPQRATLRMAEVYERYGIVFEEVQGRRALQITFYIAGAHARAHGVPAWCAWAC